MIDQRLFESPLTMAWEHRDNRPTERTCKMGNGGGGAAAGGGWAQGRMYKETVREKKCARAREKERAPYS